MIEIANKMNITPTLRSSLACNIVIVSSIFAFVAFSAALLKDHLSIKLYNLSVQVLASGVDTLKSVPIPNHILMSVFAVSIQ